MSWNYVHHEKELYVHMYSDMCARSNQKAIEVCMSMKACMIELKNTEKKNQAQTEGKIRNYSNGQNKNLRNTICFKKKLYRRRPQTNSSHQ